MTLTNAGSSRGFDRWGQWAVALVLILAFVTGGGSRDRGIGDVITQLLALPLGLWSLFVLCKAPPKGLQRAAIAVALLILATLVLQQLPLPEGVWRSVALRDELATDQQVAGLTDARHLWSLSPLASERGLWSLMPALAVFLGALALPLPQQRRMLLLVVGLTTASLVLGFLQLGAPQDSVLNPFPEWSPKLNGFFSNPHHQSTSLAISIVILAALLLSERGSEPALETPPWMRFTMIALAILLLAALPLTGSRAVMLLAVLALVAVPVVLRFGRGRAAKASVALASNATVKLRAMQVLLGLLGLATILAAVGWLRHDIAEESRWAVAKVTAGMGASHVPFGAGVGSFVSWFEQTAPASLVKDEYYNHAHNEFAQWWFESGVLGVASMLSVFALLIACYPNLPSTRSGAEQGIAVAAWIGCSLLLVHSLVDYPLRTATLMTVGGLLAGIVVAQRLGYESRRVRRDPLPHPSTEQA